MTFRVRQPVWAWLLIFNLAAAFYSVGAAWLAQLNWQLWRFVGTADFDALSPCVVAWDLVGHLSGRSACLPWRGRPGALAVTERAALDDVGRASPAGAYLLRHGPVWGPGQSQLHRTTFPDGTLDAKYAQLVVSNWIPGMPPCPEPRRRVHRARSAQRPPYLRAGVPGRHAPCAVPLEHLTPTAALLV
jgi:hypothetical protein